MSELQKSRIEAILEVFDCAVDLGDFQQEARRKLELELSISVELDFLDAPEHDIDALQKRYNYLKLGGEWGVLTTEAREVYLAGFEDAMKALGVKP